MEFKPCLVTSLVGNASLELEPVRATTQDEPAESTDLAQPPAHPDSHSASSSSMDESVETAAGTLQIQEFYMRCEDGEADDGRTDATRITFPDLRSRHDLPGCCNPVITALEFATGKAAGTPLKAITGKNQSWHTHPDTIRVVGVQGIGSVLRGDDGIEIVFADGGGMIFVETNGSPAKLEVQVQCALHLSLMPTLAALVAGYLGIATSLHAQADECA